MLLMFIEPMLADIDKQTEQNACNIAYRADAQGITEQLKAENALEWVGKINTGV